ncbi:hypothetical protein VCJ71_05990 [Alteriqipengyuania sp. WL0013]|uniref:hypothetical protein n=1 Tax=Alteriqipengyuania sp. WL0013 TaxID=3110773 RepID=UPI002C68572E|nr:hypothetical protein [Alteriqipengyuania sp. WL0013]MEB3415611.1 hypothetical protein [Alteriqipengyuania sp. WL0013]
MQKLLIIDVGTHKAEEVRLFAGDPSWTIRNRLRMVRAKRLAEIAETDRLSRQFRSIFDCRYILIEPVMHRELIDFAGKEPCLLLNGVTSCDADGPVDLLMAEDSLGNSIIPTKPNLTGEKKTTFNFNFPHLYEYLVETFADRQIVIRMNAEGVEGPIIDYLAHAKVRPALLAGSIGDIRKCFGEEAYAAAQATMERADIPFVYLTSHPRYWADGLRKIMDILR